MIPDYGCKTEESMEDMIEHLRGKIKLSHGLPDSPTEGACLLGKDKEDSISMLSKP
jgi:hypothetical protein